MQYKVLAAFAAVACSFALAANGEDTSDPFCACPDCCYVDNTTDFSYKNLVSLTYKDVSLTGHYTVLDDGGTHDFNGTTRDGTPYQYVVRYKNTPVKTFDNNLRIFTSDTDATLNCSESFLYYDSMKIPLLERSESDLTYCYLDINDRLTRDQLRDYTSGDGVYFAFNHLVEERSEFRIMFDVGNRVIPVDDIRDYQYFLNSTTLSSGNEESDFWIKFTLEISDINDMPVDAVGCKDLTTLVSELYLGPHDADAAHIEACTLAFFPGFSAPAIPEYGETATYEYALPQSLYERCAESVTSDGDKVVFKSTLNFPVRSPDDKCFYFQPGFSTQPVTITMDADVTEHVQDTFQSYSLELVSVDLERCGPIEDYVIPQATAKFTLKTVHAGADTTLAWHQASQPYLGDISEGNVLYGGLTSGSDAPSFSCVVMDEGTSTPYTECLHYFKTKKCEKIYTVIDDSGLTRCGFERSNARFLYNFEFREQLEGGLYVSHRAPRLDTNLEFTTFPGARCQAPDERAIINVDDIFPAELKVRNYYQGEEVDWVGTPVVNFNDRVILRLGVGEESSTSFQDLSVFLKTVVVTLSDQDDNVLTQAVFNVAEKEEFMRIPWSLYYNDPQFCSFYDSESSGNKCQPFFDSATTRWNPWHTANYNASMVDDVCQVTNTAVGAADTRNTDFFTFDPAKWFVDLHSRPYIKVAFTANAVLYECENLQRRALRAETPSLRRGLQEDGGSGLPVNSVMYVSNEIVITIGGDGNGDSVVVEGDASISAFLKNKALLYALGAVAGVIILTATIFTCSRCARWRQGYGRAHNDDYHHDFLNRM